MLLFFFSIGTYILYGIDAEEVEEGPTEKSISKKNIYIYTL